jgi:glucosylceramidase
MKTNGSKNNGRQLKRTYYPLWAEYICRYIAAYRDAGVRVGMLSIQNEPAATQTWDSCVYSPQEEKEFLQ